MLLLLRVTGNLFFLRGLVAVLAKLPPPLLLPLLVMFGRAS